MAHLKAKKQRLEMPAQGVRYPCTWTGYVQGPLQTIWASGVFKIEVTLPKNYPFVPCSVRFVDPLYHPNIMSDQPKHSQGLSAGAGSQSGSVSIRMLNDCWSPGMTITTVMICIRALLGMPNFSETDHGHAQTAQQLARLIQEDYARRQGERPRKLYHYTDMNAKTLIERTKFLKSGGGAYGNGVYATALHPTQRTKTQMLMNNYGGIRQGRVDFVVELDTGELERAGYNVALVASQAPKVEASPNAKDHGQTAHEDVWLIRKPAGGSSDVQLTDSNCFIASWEVMSSCALNTHAAQAYKHNKALYVAGVMWCVGRYGFHAALAGHPLQGIDGVIGLDEVFGGIFPQPTAKFEQDYFGRVITVWAAPSLAIPNPAAAPASGAAPKPAWSVGCASSDFWNHYTFTPGSLSLPGDLEAVTAVKARDVGSLSLLFASAGDVCSICRDGSDNDPDDQIVTLHACKHAFHESCLEQWFRQKAACPDCKASCGTVMGSGPKEGGAMVWTASKQTCDNTPVSDLARARGKGSMIEVSFTFKQGWDDAGKRYEGRYEMARLPMNEEGVVLLEFFKIAFTRRIMFGIGTRLAHGTHAPTFNIHIKTSTSGGATGHGWPDAAYFSRAIGELEGNHISWADLEKRMPWVRGTHFGAHNLPPLPNAAPAAAPPAANEKRKRSSSVGSSASSAPQPTPKKKAKGGKKAAKKAAKKPAKKPAKKKGGKPSTPATPPAPAPAPAPAPPVPGPSADEATLMSILQITQTAAGALLKKHYNNVTAAVNAHFGGL
eukprot:TRINITY_DN3760_c0_g1_i3.p1 TRINITY_DN3760_c0_g1~~TRINITY_DN3760_c0_g1_i3.p1  ORF type:complete len:859 (+),score=216.68 TRINITY_DN3760_c0_g1_i3:247-2577(+)